MGWQQFSLLLVACYICATESKSSQPAVLHGQWRERRSLQTTYHYSCTLPLKQSANYLAVKIHFGSSYAQFVTWDLDLLEESYSENGSIVVYQTKAGVRPPRYVLNFHLITFSTGYKPTCTWDILENPLLAVTTMGRMVLPTDMSTSFDYWSTTVSSVFGLDQESACDYVTESFVVWTRLEVQTMPPRGPRQPTRDGLPLSGTFNRALPRGRRQVTTPPEIKYTEALELSLSFYDAQRSGQIPAHPANSPNKWTKASGLNHVTTDGRDLTGGWYNGNDGVKITLPIAYSAAMLQMGYTMWPEVYEDSGLTEKFLDTVKWALDYLEKCFDADQETLYVQVGNIEMDRNVWERFDSAVYQDMTRQIYNVSIGSDVAADMATAFALASEISIDIGEKSRYLTIAKSLYNFAKTKKGKADIENTDQAFPTYVSTDYSDDLCLAAIWLFHVTYDSTYLRQAKTRFKDQSKSLSDSSMFSWDNKYAACAVFLYSYTGIDEYRNYILEFIDSWIYRQLTDEGFPIVDNNSSTNFVANAVFISLLAVEHDMIDDASKTLEIISWSSHVMNHILGWNEGGQSYQIGYSQNYPLNPDHKNSACPNNPASCGQNFYKSTTSNTNTLFGALVGGPDSEGQYTDQRTNTPGNSVMLDYNAGFTAALAGLQNYREMFEWLCSRKSETTTPYETTEWIETTTTTTTTVPTTTTPMQTAPPVTPTVFNYTRALSNSILFYMAQRGFEIPANYPVNWRKGEEISTEKDRGGWFDDGSNLKTSVATSSAVTLLSLGALKYASSYANANKTAELQGTLRVALNYLSDSFDEFDDSVLCVYKDRAEAIERGTWNRPYDSYSRSTKQYLPLNQGSNVVAGGAAALALGSQVFKDEDASYSATLLQRAVKLYAFSKTLDEPFNDTESLYYNCPGDAEDEKCVAAFWLFRGTGDTSYITPFINSYSVVRQTEMSWKNQHVLCQLFLYETTGQSKYRSAVNNFLQYWMDSGVQYTPEGLAWYNDSGPLRYSANAAFVALMAADLGFTPSKSRAWAKSQIDYMLGKNSNAYSYQIGYGDRYPRRPHHRSSSCPDELVPCDWSVYNSARPNPHVLTGALVGGPDKNDFHEDARTNYTMNRVSVDYNAGFQSVLAGLIEHFPHQTTSTTTTTTTTTTTAAQTIKPTLLKITTVTTKPPTLPAMRTKVPSATTKRPSTKQTPTATTQRPTTTLQNNPLTVPTLATTTTQSVRTFGSTEESVSGSPSLSSSLCFGTILISFTFYM